MWHQWQMIRDIRLFECNVQLCATWTGGVSPGGEGLQEWPRGLAPCPGEAVDVISEVSPELLNPRWLPLLLQHPAGCNRCHSHQWKGRSDGYLLHTLQQVTPNNGVWRAAVNFPFIILINSLRLKYFLKFPHPMDIMTVWPLLMHYRSTFTSSVKNSFSAGV